MSHEEIIKAKNAMIISQQKRIAYLQRQVAHLRVRLEKSNQVANLLTGALGAMMEEGTMPSN
jgi:uncharacterized coiled-coil protein SlyX